ncbi:MAG: bacterial transcriptional activator domain-containing protein [Firmicutes bacterium]|nr:bacterial transcriptional activator domain-containing protein [Bacillota bacterium]
MNNEFHPQAQPCYCLSDPVSNRLVYVSPAAAALCLDGRIPELSWQLFDPDPDFAAVYNAASLSLLVSCPLQLRGDSPLGARLLFSSLVLADGRRLRRDVLIALGDEPEQGLPAAIALVDRFLKATELSQLPSVEEPGEVRVTMFGGFKLETCLGKLDGAGISSRQSCLLLLYLLCNRERVVPVNELAETLWPGQLLDNPYNMVKNVAFRLRRTFAPICEKPLITAYHGTYVLNPELRFVVDCDYFETLVRQYYRAEKGDPDCLAAAIRLYRGGLLPAFETELWLLPLAQYYKDSYRQAVLDYAACMGKKGNYPALFAVLRDGLSIYPREASLHVALVHALARGQGAPVARQYLQCVAPLLTRSEQQLISRQLDKLAADQD